MCENYQREDRVMKMLLREVAYTTCGPEVLPVLQHDLYTVRLVDIPWRHWPPEETPVKLLGS